MRWAIMLGLAMAVAAAGPSDPRPRKLGDTSLNSVGMKLAYIPAGEFIMGGNRSARELAEDFGRDAEFYEREHPLHEVKITRPFLMGTCHVTRGQFADFVRATEYRTDAEREGWSYGWSDTGWGRIDGLIWRGRDGQNRQDDDHPVVCVSWNDAVAFCQWLSRKEDRHYRLPTEAEWEYTCRAGTKTEFPWGDDPEAGVGWANCADQTGKERYPSFDAFNWRDGWVYTSPVGSFKPNAWGLYDMVGNAWQWCADWNGPYPTKRAVDPTGPAQGLVRITRGGSWSWGPRGCRPAARGQGAPADRDDAVGFRVVVDVP